MALLARRWHRWHVVGTSLAPLACRWHVFFFPDVISADSNIIVELRAFILIYIIYIMRIIAIKAFLDN
jgi:hypothetical protein